MVLSAKESRYLQESCQFEEQWWLQRGKPTNPELIRDATPEEAVAQLSGRADWLFLDTAPAMLEELELAVEAANFCLIPVLASALDLIAARSVVSLCQEQGIPFAFMINRENGRRETLNGSAATHLKKLGVLLSATLQDRAAYVSTMMHGNGAGTLRQQASACG